MIRAWREWLARRRREKRIKQDLDRYGVEAIDGLPYALRRKWTGEEPYQADLDRFGVETLEELPEPLQRKWRGERGTPQEYAPVWKGK